MSLDRTILLDNTDCFYNTRTKYYIDRNGNEVAYEVVTANRQIFKASGAELSELRRTLTGG